MLPTDPAEPTDHVDPSDVVATPTLSVRRIAIALAATAVTLSVVSYAMHVVTLARGSGSIAALDVGDEVSVATWFQTLLLAVAALVLVLGGWRAAQQGARDRGWFLLAFVMLALSVDEAVSLHEKAGSGLRDLLDASGVLYYVWVVPALAFVVVVAVLQLGWLRRLPAPTRRLVILAGVVFVVGAAGFELLAASGDEVYGTDTLTSKSLSAVEELAEMAGMSLFVVALLAHLRGDWLVVRLR